ncbi:MAG TPA: GNAT family N-acetyltransferase, partial [Thiomicrospira sp.]|nr:GNAT family N-acetyltransferase [Thiomicrospira sp.]
SPVSMQSTHWLPFNPFEQGIQQFIKQEQQGVDAYMKECIKHSPYKSE